MTKADESPMAVAAAALDAELERFEALAATLRKMPLTSKKNLERAARSLEEAAGFEERLAGRLRGLIEAINGASKRQQESATSIVERAREIQARNDAYAELFEQYAALGGEAKELTALAQEVATARAANPTAVDGATLGRIDELLARMGNLGERAQAISRTAAERQMNDLERDADVLKQQFAAAGKKLALLRRGPGGAEGKSN